MSIMTQPAFAFGSPALIPMGGLAVPNNAHGTYDVMPDGKRFIGTINGPWAEDVAASTPQIQIVLTWFQDLKPRVAAH